MATSVTDVTGVQLENSLTVYLVGTASITGTESSGTSVVSKVF